MEIEIRSIVRQRQQIAAPGHGRLGRAQPESKAILGQTMSAEAQSTGIGSGNADLHDAVRHDILQGDARQLEGTITRDLLYPLLALNRGGIDSLSRCPRLVFDTGAAEDLTAYAESLPKLVAAGMKRIPTRWVHEKLRIPEAADDEETLGAPAPSPVPAAVLDEPIDPVPDPAGADPTGADPEVADPAKPAALAALAAVASKADRAAAGQDALDDLAELMADEWQPTMERLLTPIEQLAAEVSTLEELRARLPGVIAEMDTAAVADLLARGQFAAHVSGRATPGKVRP
jgi:phage gp29-like protein